MEEIFQITTAEDFRKFVCNNEELIQRGRDIWTSFLLRNPDQVPRIIMIQDGIDFIQGRLPQALLGAGVVTRVLREALEASFVLTDRIIFMKTFLIHIKLRGVFYQKKSHHNSLTSLIKIQF